MGAEGQHRRGSRGEEGRAGGPDAAAAHQQGHRRSQPAGHLPQPRRQPEGLPQRHHRQDVLSSQGDTRRAGTVATPQVEGATPGVHYDNN